MKTDSLLTDSLAVDSLSVDSLLVDSLSAVQNSGLDTGYIVAVAVVIVVGLFLTYIKTRWN